MTARLRVLLPSDVFPPRSGGAGWSAHALALALIERGHDVTAIVPRRQKNDERQKTKDQVLAFGPSSFVVGPEDVLGVPTVRVDYWAPNIPIAQNYFRHERFWPRLATVLVDLALSQDQRPTANGQRPISSKASSLVGRRSSLIIHAQHVQAAPAAVLAARRLGAPVVVTVRDHWPWDYFATGLHADRIPYARQTWASLAADLPARLGPLRGALALPAIPYMLAHLRRRQAALRQADAVIAVSRYMADRLAGIVPAERLHVIPNMVDLAAIDAAIAQPPASLTPGQPYLLFVGKLERNKGAHLLVEVFRELRAIGDWGSRIGDREAFASQFLSPNSQSLELVIAGNGPLRPELERDLAALGVPARFLEWADHDEVLRLMARCELLLFPSAWGEPLSRVPLEASACGAPILAMPTGGTADIIADGVNGALEPTVAGFARRLAALLAAPAERRALGAAARRVAAQRFAKQAVVGQVEALYRTVGRP
jgi:glycosyltransferase involved in cell wall biosynthesis